jgi:hypothetical protein
LCYKEARSENLNPLARCPAFRVTAVGPTSKTRGTTQADDAENQFEKSIPRPARQTQNVDATRLRQDANELANLAQSIPPAIGQTTKGLLPKDLDQKLKRIEKLAKQLRSQIDH